MKKLITATTLCIGLGLTGTAFAEKYAVVDLQQAAYETNYMKTQRASLEAALKPQQQQQEKLAKEINEIQQKAESQGKNMKEADLQKLEKDYENKVRAYNDNAASMQQRLQAQSVNIEKNLGPKIEQVVNNLRTQGGYSLIIDRNAVVSFDPSVDLTSKVTQEVNKLLK